MRRGDSAAKGAYERNQRGRTTSPQCNIDDNTQKPVNVLSVTGGIVVAAEKSWDESSALRGGIYVWIYDPGTKGMFYYAHNSELLVEVGQVVTPGEVIAHVGRTGLNAYKQRSPTHLHITYLKVKESGDPAPTPPFSAPLSIAVMPKCGIKPSFPPSPPSPSSVY